nr:AHH domain-containing protein [Myxococcus sp. RHSTA-1-4]
MPYPWQAHHLLPTNFFYKNLTMKEIKIILRSDYDINDGRNLIFLPERPVDTLAHKLPFHASQHPSYDKKVVRQMGNLKRVLDEVAKKEIEHKDAAAKVEEQIHKLETKMFKYTRDLGGKPRQKLN